MEDARENYLQRQAGTRKREKEKKRMRKRRERAAAREERMRRRSMRRRWREKKKKKVKAVLFAPYTKNSALAMKLREAEEKLATLTGYKLKIVERAGTKLEDLLTKSNPWQGIDCGRKLCLLCETKEKTGKNKGQDCHKRSCVYEIWCIDCQEAGEKEVEGKYTEDEKESLKEKIEKEKSEIKRYKYIGETSRSIYERSAEHQLGLTSLNKDSYMLKHFVDKHGGEDLGKKRFALKVIKFTRTSFERQILESVQLQANREHHLLNSKSEYNRCAIPRLSSKIGKRSIRSGVLMKRRRRRKIYK